MPSSLSAFIKTVVELCRFRRAPQDIPYSPRLLGVLLVASTLFDLAVGAATGDAEGAFAHSLLSSALVLALCWTALAIRRLNHRYVQTATALVACGLLISLVQLPIALLLQPSAPKTEAASSLLLPFLLSWIALGVLVWQIMIYAHIMRHAMESRFGLAVALTTSWVIGYLALARILFGAQG
ncbi:MAG: hypothetical protein ABW187_11580 [Dokdonella sp.]